MKKSILRKKYLINEGYTCCKIGILIVGEKPLVKFYKSFFSFFKKMLKEVPNF